MTALVLVEHEGGAVKDATLAAVTAAAQLGAVHALVAGEPGEPKASPRRWRRSPGSRRCCSPPTRPMRTCCPRTSPRSRRS